MAKLPSYQQTFLASGTNSGSLMGLYTGTLDNEYVHSPAASNMSNTQEYDPQNPGYETQTQSQTSPQGNGQEQDGPAIQDSWNPLTIDPDNIGTLKINQLDTYAASLTGTGQLGFWRTASKVNDHLITSYFQAPIDIAIILHSIYCTHPIPGPASHNEGYGGKIG